MLRVVLLSVLAWLSVGGSNVSSGRRRLQSIESVSLVTQVISTQAAPDGTWQAVLIPLHLTGTGTTYGFSYFYDGSASDLLNGGTSFSNSPGSSVINAYTYSPGYYNTQKYVPATYTYLLVDGFYHTTITLPLAAVYTTCGTYNTSTCFLYGTSAVSFRRLSLIP